MASPPAASASVSTPARALAALLVPAVLVGIGSSLVLLLLSKLAAQLQRLYWTTIPRQLGFGHWDRWWMLVVLTGTGVLVGLVVWLMPGHGGPDPSTVSLVGPPEPPAVLPSVAVATVLALAGGVSLGPENPITMLNIALAYALGRRFLPAAKAPLWISLAVSGTIGALFGAPIASALIISEIPGRPDEPRSLWDRLFAPLASAVSGAMTTLLIAGNDFVIDVPEFTGTRPVYLLWALLTGSAGALLGLAAVYAFAPLHSAFQRIGNPLVMLTVGGLLLGLLGALGGHLTLFKGLDEVKELVTTSQNYSAWGLLGLVLVRVAALLVAATCGFRGGRIFPAVFAGVALGCAAHGAVASVPVSLAIACSILGVLLAVTRQGWLSLFTAAAIVPDTRLLSFLCVAALPAWLLVTGRREMLIQAPGSSA